MAGFLRNRLTAITVKEEGEIRQNQNERITIFPSSTHPERCPGNWIMFAYLDGALIGLLKPMRL